MTQPAYLTTGQAAKHFGVHYRTVLRWIEKETLKAHRLPNSGNYRIAYSDLLAFSIENNMQESLAETIQTDILVIDDESSYTSAISRILNQKKYLVTCAHSCFEGGMLLLKLSPRLLILDLNMPTINGCELLIQIRKQRAFDSLKIIVISAQDDLTLQAMLMHGANDYLEKPFINEELINKVNHLLQTSISD